MAKRKWLSLAAALAGLALVVTACGSGGGGAGGSESGAAGTIKIGVTAPLSGDYASAGTDIVNAAKLAADEINAKGGVLGKKIEIVAEDDQCDSQVGVQAAQKLMDEGVVAVAGGYCSSASIPETGVLAQKHVAFVADASTNPDLTDKNPGNVFRVIGRDDQQGPFAAKFIAEVLGAKKAAVIHDNTTYAKGLAEEAKKGLEADGVQVVYFDAITPGEKDYTSTLTTVKGLNPDVIYYTGYFAEAGLLVKQARELGITATFMGGDATQDPTLIATAGDKAEGMIITTAPLPQFLTGAQDFVQSYKSKYGQDPGPYSVYEYDCVKLVADAIQRANSTDPEKIVEALKQTKNYKGLTGDITFNEKGDRTGELYITTIVKDGKFQPYKKYENGQWVDIQ
ncbi:MAG: branched-chain amino acid ABC transporter substrate-binding protein [Firmicutes bacterium]|nr:branched-chain amino acid ABC transporter substrate-binding protein [Bacillota bacterium]